MDLLDRYLQSVGRHLGAARSADILAELRANLEAQLEEREAELGRPLMTAEAEAWIKQLGSPFQMAARYLLQQSLIGPGLFPTYWYVLRLVLVWATAIYLLVSAVLIGINGIAPEAIVEALLRVPTVLFTAAAWVTLIFAALEFASQRSPRLRAQLQNSVGTFDPAGIPGLDEEHHHGRRPRTYAHAAAEFIFGVLALCWLLLIPANPYLLMGPGYYYYLSLPYRIAPVWMHIYWAIVALNIVQTAWAGFNLYTGKWQGSHRFQRLTIKALGFVPLGLLLAAPGHLLFVLRDPAADEVRLAHTLFTINDGVTTAFRVVLLVVAVQFVWELARTLYAVLRPADTR